MGAPGYSMIDTSGRLPPPFRVLRGRALPPETRPLQWWARDAVVLAGLRQWDWGPGHGDEIE